LAEESGIKVKAYMFRKNKHKNKAVRYFSRKAKTCLDFKQKGSGGQGLKKELYVVVECDSFESNVAANCKFLEHNIPFKETQHGETCKYYIRPEDLCKLPNTDIDIEALAGEKKRAATKEQAKRARSR